MKGQATGRVRRYPEMLEIAVLTVVYFSSGKLGLTLAFVNASATAVWPPTGVGLAALLIFGYRVWPGIMLGAFLVNVTTTGTVATSLPIACGNTVEGLLGAYLVNRFANGRNAFNRTKDIFGFVIVAWLVSMISATVGAATLDVGGLAASGDYGAIWLTWWTGDTVGAMVITPLLLLWASTSYSRLESGRLLEAALLMIAFFLVGQTVFGGLISPLVTRQPLTFVCLPLLIWAALRFNQRVAATAVFVLASIAILGVVRGFGPFVRSSENESLLLLQAFIAMMAVTTMVLAAAVFERKQAQEGLRNNHTRLETRVKERTADLSRTTRELEQKIAEHRQAEETIIRLAAIVESSDDAIIGKTLEGTILSWNKAAERMYGYGFDDVKGQSVTILVPSDRPDETSRLLKKIGTGERIENYETVRVRKDGTRIEVSVTISPINDMAGNVVGASAIDRDITERKQADRKLRASEARLAGILKIAEDAVISINESHQITLFNHGAERIFDYDASEVVGRLLDMLIPQRFTGTHSRYLGEFAKSTEPARGMGGGREVYGRRKNGDEFPAEATISKLQVNGEVVFTIMLRDITERKRADDLIKSSLAEKEVLLKEIHHRVKNNLQIIWSLLNLQCESVRDLPSLSAFRDSQSRVESMALVHELLYQSGDLARIDFNKYLDVLTADLIASYAIRPEDITLKIPFNEIFLSVELALPCGLIITELVSNSLKHAFPTGKGQISIDFEERSDGDMVLTIADNGIGLPQNIDFRNAQSLGLQLVNGLAGQLNGSIEARRSSGTEFKIAFHESK